MATALELTALMAKSDGRWVTKTLRKRALNYGRARISLRETVAGLNALQATAGYLTVKDTANQRWMREQ